MNTVIGDNWRHVDSTAKVTEEASCSADLSLVGATPD